MNKIINRVAWVLLIIVIILLFISIFSSKKEGYKFDNVDIVESDFKIASSLYNIKEENNKRYMYDIELKTNVEDFLKTLEIDSKYVHIYDLKDKEVKDNKTILGTGFTITYEKDKKYHDVVRIIILGDINGDGISDDIDKNHINKNILGEEKLEGIKFKAGDVNNDSYINVQDLTIVNNYISGKIDTYNKKDITD